MAPRISAANIPEHVAKQERAVFDAAVRLFTERGYEQVTLSDIAAEVGLARNSLYRYFPGKAEILVRWVNRELEIEIGRSEAVLNATGDPGDRIRRWADQQLEYARRPEHKLLVSFAGMRGEFGPETEEALRSSHNRLRSPLLAAVAETGVDPEEVELTSDLIIELVHAASRRSGDNELALKGRLHQGINGLIGH